MWKIYRTVEFKFWFDSLESKTKEVILKDVYILSSFMVQL